MPLIFELQSQLCTVRCFTRGLSERLENSFKKLRAKGKLTEADVKEAMREVRLALLEAVIVFAASDIILKYLL